MDINFWAVLVCGVLALAIGYVWYGPMFGRKWQQVIGATAQTQAERAAMQAKAGPLYLLQFVLSVFQAWVLAWLITNTIEGSAVSIALWAWGGFVVPVVAGTAMWNNDSSKVAWTRFFLQAGYQLVLFIVFALVLGWWI